MKHIKKNDQILIKLIQSCSYLLMVTDINKNDLPVNAIQNKQWKKLVNSEIAGIKRDIRKLKRV